MAMYVVILARLDEELFAPSLDAPRDEEGNPPFAVSQLSIHPECIATADRIDDLPAPQQLAAEYESNHEGESL